MRCTFNLLRILRHETGSTQILRTHWQYSAKGAIDYLGKADYYATSTGELLGTGFEHLDISNMLPRDVLHCLCHNLDPATGNLLRPRAKEGDRVGMDFTFNAPKSVTLARELGGEGNEGDPRVEAAHREAVAYAMKFIEADMKTRVRIGGANADRATGNLCAYRVTHRDTRINPDDKMPDPHLHDHCFVLNITYDKVEKRFKAAQIADIKRDAPYYEAVYMNRLAGNVRSLGYGIRREGRAFEINGIDRPLIERFSRRTKQIEALAAKLKIQKAESKAKLGATSRMGKTQETAEDLNSYYVGRLTDKQREQLAGLIGQPGYRTNDKDAAGYAIEHLFEKHSVIEKQAEKKLLIEALRFGFGSVDDGELRQQLRKQGVLYVGEEATTRKNLAQERFIIDFAREGKGTMRPLGADIDLPISEIRAGSKPQHSSENGQKEGHIRAPTLGQQKGRPDESKRPHLMSGCKPLQQPDTATLSREPQAVSSDTVITKADVFFSSSDPRPLENNDIKTSRHGIEIHSPGPQSVSLSAEQLDALDSLLASTNAVNVVDAGQGTGKTTMLEGYAKALAGTGTTWLGTTHTSVDELHKVRLPAMTVAAFLHSPKEREKAKGHRLIIDEASMLSHKDCYDLTAYAKANGNRLDLVGDSKQYKTPSAGHPMKLLTLYGGVQPITMTQTRRQTGKLRQAMESIRADQELKGHDLLTEMGMVHELPREELAQRAADLYLRWTKPGESIPCVSPTHAQAAEVAAKIREGLKARGDLKGEDHTVKRLVNLGWSVAQLRDAKKNGAEGVTLLRYGAYREEALPLASGDRVRTTMAGATKDGHRMNTGQRYTVKGFNKDGDPILNNGWVVDKNWGGLNQDYVSTGQGSQGTTAWHGIVVYGTPSLVATRHEGFYVPVSRVRKEVAVLTDNNEELRKAIQRRESKKLAVELFPEPRIKRPHRRFDRMRTLLGKTRERFRLLQASITGATKEREQQRGRYGFGR